MFLKGLDYYKDKYNKYVSRKGYVDPQLLPDQELLGFVLEANNSISKGILEQTLDQNLKAEFNLRLGFVYKEIPKIMHVELIRNKVYESIYWEEYNAILDGQWISDSVSDNPASIYYTNFPNFTEEYKKGYAAYSADVFAKTVINSTEKEFFNLVGDKENHLLYHIIEDSHKNK